MERKEAIEVVKKNWPDSSFTRLREALETLIPKLAESEDERIRKELLNAFQESEDSLYMVLTPHRRESFIAWLEKQGEQKPDEVEPKFKVGQIIREKGSYKTFTIEAIKEHYYELSDHCVCEFKHQDKWELVNQKSDNKVEPKFHKDEWVTNGDYTWKIVEVKPLDYILQSQDGNIVDNTISHVDEQFHSFTIRDARAGDVLVRNNCTFIFMGIKNGIVQALEKYLLGNGKPVCFGEPNNDGDYHPATKEQRDALERAITNAGYRWDKEKLKLEKI